MTCDAADSFSTLAPGRRNKWSRAAAEKRRPQRPKVEEVAPSPHLEAGTIDRRAGLTLAKSKPMAAVERIL